MKKIRGITVIFLLFCFATMRAYDLTVSVLSERSHKKLTDLSVEAIYAKQDKIWDAICQNDSTYSLKGLPNDTITISIIAGTKVIDKIIPKAIDSLVIEISVDEMSRQLGEVVVEADMQYLDDEKATFIPAANAKKISASGIELLQNMAIPSIEISPTDNSVKTINGEGIATYIDYMPATQNDLNNLRTMEVARVEVYDYPKDPRFNGERHVVNIILKKYEYGGYTKLWANQSIIDNQGQYGLSTKFAYKKLSYDLAVNTGYNRNSHVGGYTVADYRFPEETVTRIEYTENGLSKNQWVSTALRAVYQSQKSVISNTIGVSATRQPDCFQVDNSSFSSPLYTSGVTSAINDSRNILPSWNGSYQFFLSENFTLIFNPAISYGDFSQNYVYTSGNSIIKNYVDETAWNFSADMTLQKRIKNHTVSLSFSGGSQNNDLDYAGTTPSKVTTKYYYGGGSMMVNLGFDKIWVQGNVGLYYNHTGINSQKKDEISPKYFIAAGYNINNKNSISISSEMSHWTIPLSQQGDNIQFLNQIDAIQGNPDLNTYLYNSVNLQYQWLYSNKFSMALYTSFNRFTDPVSYIYYPTLDYTTPMMMRQYINDGFLNSWSYGCSTTLKLVNNSLYLRVGLFGENVSSHCAGNHISDNLLSFSGLVQYTHKGFWAQISYNSTRKNISTFSCSETPHFYRFSMGWGNGNLNISVSANNPFTSSWNSIKTIISEPNYNYETTAYSSQHHRSFQFSVSYSLSYGKKVNRTNDPSVSAVGSAILE